MNFLTTLGSIGGILYLVAVTYVGFIHFGKFLKKYKELERFYEEHHGKEKSQYSTADKAKMPAGFMTKKEEEEIKNRLSAKFDTER